MESEVLSGLPVLLFMFLLSISSFGISLGESTEHRATERRADARPLNLESRDKSKRDKGIVLGLLQVFGLSFLLLGKVLENPPVYFVDIPL